MGCQRQYRRLTLPHPHPSPAAVLRDELNASGFEGALYGGKVVGARRITLRLEIGNCAEATVMDEADIWRSAKALIDSYGADATIHAAMRADKLLAQGDLDGAGTWRRVLDAVKELERTEPRGAVH